LAMTSESWPGGSDSPVREIGQASPSQPGAGLPGPASPEVLWSRLVPARLPKPFLPRDRLRQALSEGLARRLVLLVAGPGYGKTTELVHAVACASSPAIWLSCDERINDEQALIAHLLQALDPLLPEPAAQAPTDTGSSVIGLCNGLARWGEDVV